MRRWLFALSVSAALVASAAPLGAESAKPVDNGIDPSIGKVEVTLDLPKDKPYVGEMIMLRMRSFIRADVVLDQIKQPFLVNFDSQQLGRDKPIEAMVDGFNVAGFERDVAIFPQQAGRLIIDPFVRSVTIQKDDNSRIQADFASKLVFVDVQNHTSLQPPDVWWLPAKALTITDHWSVPPDEIKPGDLARRTVTIEAVGLTADRLPPPPVVSAPGTIVFKGPAERETTVTENGPVARAVYQWDIRPVSTSPAQLPAIHVPWFDTSERRLRDAAIPDLWVAYVGTLVHTSHERTKTAAETYLSAGPLAIGAAGFVWTVAFAVFALSGRRQPKRPLQRRALRTIRRAARFNDEPAFRIALAGLVRDDPRRWAIVSKTPSVQAGLAALDRSRFARDGGTAPPLKPLGAAIAERLEALDESEAPRQAALPALDGPIAADLTASWSDRWRRGWSVR